MDDLGARRTRRWWQTGRPIRSIGKAGTFVEDVGFALLFPTAGVALPSLYEAASEQPMPLAETGWGPDEQRVWGWKDALPRKGLAWSGRLLGGGRASFLALDLLADCYPRAGEPDDFRQAPLGEEARRIAETLLSSGPLPTAVLRQAVGLQGRRGGGRSPAGFWTPCSWARTASWPARSAGRRQLPTPRWTSWWTVARRCWRRARTGPACSAGTRPGGSGPDFLRARDNPDPCVTWRTFRNGC